MLYILLILLAKLDGISKRKKKDTSSQSPLIDDDDDDPYDEKEADMRLGKKRVSKLVLFSSCNPLFLLTNLLLIIIYLMIEL